MEHGGANEVDYKVPGSHVDENNFHEAKVPLRHRLTLLANKYIRSIHVQILICLLTAASCVLYVVETYVSGGDESVRKGCREDPSATLMGECPVIKIVVLEWFELFFGISFCFDYFMCLFYSASMLSFVFRCRTCTRTHTRTHVLCSPFTAPMSHAHRSLLALQHGRLLRLALDRANGQVLYP